MKRMMWVAAVAAAAVAMTAEAARSSRPAARPTPQALTAEQIAKRRAFMQKMTMKHTGGKVRRPGTAKGSVAFVNGAGEKAPMAMLRPEAEKLSKLVMIKVDCLEVASVPKAGLQAERQRLGANAAVFFTWDEGCDVPMLYAPEQHWAVVNCRVLKEGASSEAAYALRFVKEAKRAFSYVCGAGGSMGGGGIMGVTRVAELERADADLELDITSRYGEFLRTIGVSPWEEATYKRACEQGWAPAPTNDYQKAIWDKVHQLPTAPIRILPEKKRVAR